MQIETVNKQDKRFYVYILRCSDNSLYTGVTTDYIRRFNEHQSQSIKAAKYMISHRAIKTEAVFSLAGRSNAQKLEYRIKHLSKSDKEELIRSDCVNNTVFEDFEVCKVI